MPVLSFDRFDGGWDVRQLATSADANRLRVLENAYVTTGRTIRKRAGLRRVGQLMPGTVGLMAAKNALWTFSTNALRHRGETAFVQNAVLSDVTGNGLDEFLHGEVFNGFLYVSVRHKGALTRHHYVTADIDTEVKDALCPHSPMFAKKAAKLFAIDKDVVRFSATQNAVDWSTPEDAGFLPVNLQQTGASRPTALGEYQNNLVVFFADSAQLWNIDPDPKLHRMVDTVPIGTAYPYAHANMTGDIFFLSPAGFRSVGLQSFGNNLTDNDIGSPIDAPLREMMRGDIQPKTLYFRAKGQLLCFIGNQAFVYSFSRSAKISAWSVWTFPFAPSDIAEFDGKLYLRHGDVLYLLDDTANDDDGVPFETVIESPYLDCKSPGILKQFTGCDVAAAGNLSLQFKTRAGRDDYITEALRLSDDTRAGARLPVEVMATNIALRITNRDNLPFELAGVMLDYHNLTGFAT